MRYVILIAAAAFLASPAICDQPPDLRLIPAACKNTPMAKATKDFVVNFNAANTAYQAKNYAGALEALDLARPHAASGVEHSAIAQIEIAALLGLDQKDAAIPLLRAIVDEPCLTGAARENFRNILTEKEAGLAGSGQQH